MMEEFGPEQVRAEERTRLRNASKEYAPLVFQWIERAFEGGYESHNESKTEAFIEFCETYGLTEDYFNDDTPGDRER